MFGLQLIVVVVVIIIINLRLYAQVMTSKTACTVATIQHKMKIAGLELAKACLLVLDMYEAAKMRFTRVKNTINSV